MTVGIQSFKKKKKKARVGIGGGRREARDGDESTKGTAQLPDGSVKIRTNLTTQRFTGGPRPAGGEISACNFFYVFAWLVSTLTSSEKKRRKWKMCSMFRELSWRQGNKVTFFPLKFHGGGGGGGCELQET